MKSFLTLLFFYLIEGIDDTVVLGGAALGATALTYYMTRKDPPIDPLYDFDNQSVEIDVRKHYYYYYYYFS